MHNYILLYRRREQSLFDASVLGAGEYDERRSYIRVIIIYDDDAYIAPALVVLAGAQDAGVKEALLTTTIQEDVVVQGKVRSTNWYCGTYGTYLRYRIH